MEEAKEGDSSMSPEDEVRETSRQFYAWLNRILNGDAVPLADVWLHRADVTVMHRRLAESPRWEIVWLHCADVTAIHPIGGRHVGWDAVRESFEQVAQLASNGKVELKDQVLHVVGDVAYEAGVEHGQVNLAGQQVRIEHRVTNIYQREAGAWKMAHHHTDTSPEMLDVLSWLQQRPAKALNYR